MIAIKKFAAIDIGSNAIRLLIANIVIEQGKAPQFNKSALIRVPVRLGQDAFTTGIITTEKVDKIIDAMNAYKLLMKIYQVDTFLAAATSAMREASNAALVIDHVFKKTGIQIEIIDGKKEAAIIASNDLHELLKTEANYLYVDVGGGSTEFSLFSKGALVVSKSFRAGTVRLLNNMNPEAMDEITIWIKENTAQYTNIKLIGSGGNINKIFKMSGKKQEVPLSYQYLRGRYQALRAMTYEERIYSLGLNPDRADVIIPALEIYLQAMKYSGATHIYVPKIGLSDGIVKAMYYQRLKGYSLANCLQ